MPGHASRGSRSLISSEDGATALEFAFVAPILLALLLASVEAGRFIWMDAALDHAMRSAARCTDLDPGGCTSDSLGARIDERLAELGVPGLAGEGELLLEKEACGTRVTLAVRYPPLVGGLWPSLPWLSADACLADA
jgi:hypothetical protein